MSLQYPTTKCTKDNWRSFPYTNKSTNIDVYSDAISNANSCNSSKQTYKLHPFIPGMTWGYPQGVYSDILTRIVFYSSRISFVPHVLK